MNRRDFLKGLVGTSYVVLSGSSVLAPLNALAASGAKASDGWLTTGSHFGAFKMKRKNGVIDQVIPFDRDKYPTDMINGVKGLVYNPSRVR